MQIDEVQYAPELFEYIKIFVDKHKKNGDFWLAGSQTFHMMKRVTESLVGRVGVARMFSGTECDRCLWQSREHEVVNKSKWLLTMV